MPESPSSPPHQECYERELGKRGLTSSAAAPAPRDAARDVTVSQSSIDYYEQFGQDFIASTAGIDMTALYGRFLPYVPAGGSLLDLGCGSGRDSLAFIQAGYAVTALDGSRAMVNATTALTGQPARHLGFHELDYDQEFDGVWACASLLHVPRTELRTIWKAILQSVRPGGVVYVSFKSGEGERSEGGRLFTDFTVNSLNEWLDAHSEVESVEVWETADVRPGRAEERWVNAILRKPVR